MTIFGLINKNSGPGFHRIMVPLLLMAEVDAYITNAIQEEDFEKRRPDAIYYNRTVSNEILALRSKYGFKVIVDVDDYWQLDPHHIMFRYYRDNHVPALQVRNIKQADVVTTTHERLAELIYPLNKNVVIVPNAIPDHEYFPINKTQSAQGHTRIFWQGSITHEKDIAILRSTVKHLDKDKFMMVLAGYTEAAEWERMADTFTNYKKLHGCIKPGLSPHEYYQNYQYADVCVVPLLSTRFNGYKSNLKILEAAHSSLPVIASNVHPYKEMPVLYADKKEDWLKWLNDKEALEESAVKLAAYCKEKYNFDEINKRRREVFV